MRPNSFLTTISMLGANPTKSKRRHVKKSVSAARSAGISETDIRRLLAGGRLGRALSDEQMLDISKGIKFMRWAMLMKGISQCEKMLKIKNLPADIWLAIMRANLEYLAAMRQLTQELDEIAEKSAADSNGQTSPHAFSPREPIGNVTAISVSIGKAQEQPSVTDVRSSTTDPHSPGVPATLAPNQVETLR